MSYPGEPDYELTRETYESFDIVSFTSMDIFAKLTSRVSSNSFDYADVIPSYHFSVEGIDRAYLEGLEQGVSYQSDSMDVYILRQEKDGIPITFYNSMYASRFIAWDNRCMGFTLVGEWTDNADLVNGMYVPADVDPYNIENVYEDGIIPVRIEDCIVNCIPEIAYDTSDMGALQSVVIYSAELTYLKADAFNADTMASYMWNDEYNSQVYWLIPVWKITYFAEVRGTGGTARAANSTRTMSLTSRKRESAPPANANSGSSRSRPPTTSPWKHSPIPSSTTRFLTPST